MADEARRRGLVGWVRNLRGGAVDTMFCGEPEAVQTMIEAVRRGPGFARVDAIRITDVPPGDDITFTILPTR